MGKRSAVVELLLGNMGSMQRETVWAGIRNPSHKPTSILRRCSSHVAKVAVGANGSAAVFQHDSNVADPPSAVAFPELP